MFSDKKMKKSELWHNCFNFFVLNYDVSEAARAAARGFHERIHGPTLVEFDHGLYIICTYILKKSMYCHMHAILTY